MQPHGSINCYRESSHSRQRVRASLGQALLGVLLCALGLGGCERERLSDGMPDNAERCTSCHGTPGNPAPPYALNGSWDTNDIAVGAHQNHLIASDIAGAVPCYECHPIPTELLTHPNWSGQPTAVVFGPLATRNTPSPAPAVPAWDRATASCTNTYCHGATLSGAATRPAPIWTKVDGSQRRCTSCHGFPPTSSGHQTPEAGLCEKCHGGVAGPGGTIINPARHADGVVDIGSGGGTATFHPPGYAAAAVHGPDTNQGKSNCTTCHGAQLQGAGSITGCDTCHQSGWRTNCTYCHGKTDNGTGAPPRDIFGNNQATTLGVGTHTEHVTRTTHPAYACTQCHAQVTDVMSQGHVFDTTPGKAEVTLANGLSPSGQYNAPACSNVYCHGTGRTNGTVSNFVASATSNCQSCHPTQSQSSGHTFHTAFSCDTCHSPTVSDNTTVSNPDLHVNGSVEVQMAAGQWNKAANNCVNTACHGAGAIAW